MTSDLQYNTPDQQDLVDWATAYNISHPLIADSDRGTENYVLLGYPTFVVIDRDMTILNADMWPFDDAYLRTLVNDGS